MNKFSFASLRVRLLAVVLLAIVPAMGLMFYTAVQQRQRQAAEVQEEALRLARIASADQHRLGEVVHQLLIAFSQLPQIRGKDKAACDALLANLLKQYQHYTGFAAVRPNGDVVCSAPPRARSVNFSDREWYQRIIRTRDFVVSEYQIGRISGKAAIIFAYPMLNPAGELDTIVIAGLDLTWLTQFAAQARLPSGSTLTVIDRRGIVLARYPDGEKWVGKSLPEAGIVQAILAKQREGTVESTGVDGLQRLYGFVPLGQGSEAGAYVTIGIPTDVASAAVNQELARNLIGLGIVVLLALLAAWVGSDLFVLRQVRALLGVTKRLAAGDLSARTGLPSRQGELSQLARAFDEMAESLEQHEARLREAEADLSTGEARLRGILDIAPEGIISVDESQRIVLFNKGAEQIFGYTATEIMGQPLDMLLPSHLSEAHRQHLRAFAAAPEAARLMGGRRELRGRRKDGVEFPIEASISKLIQKGQIIFTVILRDVTERKDAEERLQQQLSRLNLLNQITRGIGQRQDVASIARVAIRYLEEHLPVDYGSVCLFDPQADTLTVLVSGGEARPIADTLGLVEGTVIPVEDAGLREFVEGRTVYVPDAARSAVPLLRKSAEAGLRSVATASVFVESQVSGLLVAARRDADRFSSGDCEFLRMLGEHLGLAIHQGRLYTELQRAYEDLRQTQQAVVQQERLRAVGQMASGIAHDINNALSPAALYVESLLEREAGLSERAREYLTTIQQALGDVAHTIGRMREFYRPREPQMTLLPVRLTQVVEQVVELTRPRWRDVPQQRGIVIDLQTDLPPDLPPILGIESDLRDAFTNLIFNAVDAMPQGGTLTLRVRAEGPEEQRGRGAGEPEDAALAPLPPSTSAPPQVVVEVSDTGVGMDEETRLRCLEPFFTTKGERGTGLGLATVYGTVQRHGGDIIIESAVGRGTTVHLVFPVRTESAEGVRPAEAQKPRQSLRLLIVDDDPLIRQSLKNILEADRHAVTVADGGKAGVGIFRSTQATGTPFDVVITDLGMPEVSGREVARAVKGASPRTPVILLTGWGAQMATEKDIPADVDWLLSKPPKLRELREALAMVLVREEGTTHHDNG